jgi:cytochrome c oxidase cbb3-type subunit 3
MALEDRDAHSGYLTTGHEWNGIKELNTPVPRPVYFFLAVAVAFALGYWVLMPTWPTGTSYTKGLLGANDRVDVANSVKLAAADRAVWLSRIEQSDFAAIQADPRLMTFVRQAGRTLFGDNCAACHGRNATGGPGFPNLTTTSWLWGGTPEIIAETIRVGINATHKDTRTSQMPAFGRDQMIPRDDIERVAAYVRSLSDPAATDTPKDKIAPGKVVFAANCVACHGATAAGNPELGAPNLTDRFWIYGASYAEIYTTIWGGRQGHMPTWEARLPAVERKILALYLVDLRTRPK